MQNIPQDPMMLFSFVNMKLRDSYASLDALCDDMDADKEEILRKLSEVGYEYDKETNRFA